MSHEREGSQFDIGSSHGGATVAAMTARSRLVRGREALGRAGPGALAGVSAVAAAIAVSELAGGLIPGASSAITAIGSLVISLQPPGAKDLVVSLFGTNDKLALNLAVGIAGLGIGSAAGVLAIRHLRWAGALFGGFGLLALAAVLRDPQATAGPATLGVGLSLATGLAMLWLLVTLPRRWRASEVSCGGTMPAWERRRFLIASAGTLGGAIIAGGLGRVLIEAAHPSSVVSTSHLPAALDVVPALGADQAFQTPLLTPLIVPNDRFYRIDTALLVPRVDLGSWRLAVIGMVDRPFELDYDELLAMGLFEQYVTIACVSNRIGGDLVGNALWTGVRLKALLARAGVQAGATQVVGRSVDGFTVGFPTDWATAPEREPMVAVGMNREPLPAAHGFPARLIVPGLYGYVSATKWLRSIELTTREAVDGYWVPLGWAKDAPILTQSRIDIPGPGDIQSGRVDVAGVAWAPDRGIARVEVSFDRGPWQAAEMTRPISPATWVQWRLAWQASPGRHSIEVRATDGTGAIQTSERTDPPPDGARGHHRIFVTAA